MQNHVIKFRAWDNHDHKMIYIEDNLSPFRGYELMQFTGLHDKNGKEIYEGDVLRPDRHKEVSIVEWSETGAWVRTPYPNKRGASFFMCDGQDGIDPDHKLHYQEIIGNIYSNPELLNEKK